VTGRRRATPHRTNGTATLAKAVVNCPWSAMMFASFITQGGGGRVWSLEIGFARVRGGGIFTSENIPIRIFLFDAEYFWSISGISLLS
jgi:hypothetical protein